MLRRLNQRIPTLVTPPASEPVSLDQAKLFMRIDGSAEDSLIALLIASARRAVENYIMRSVMPQTWKLQLDAFQYSDPDPIGYHIAARTTFNESEIELPRGPVVSITSLRTFNTANAASTVSAASYALIDSRVVLNDGFTWPTGLRDEGAVEVTYVAGYTNVPEDIKQAIMMYALAMYENRTCSEMPAAVKGLLAPYRAKEAFGAW
ncbi:MAG: head-tail connector protein [Aeromonas sp.]